MNPRAEEREEQMSDIILILDFGGNQAYYTARRLRSERFYCEILPGDTDPAEIIARAPRGVMLAGGETPDGERAPALPFDPEVLGVPVLAFGCTARMLAERIGADYRGEAFHDAKAFMQFLPCPLFDGLSEADRLFGRVDAYGSFPEGWTAIATTPDEVTPAFACLEKNLYGLQFYVESNDPEGFTILENFAERVCGCPRNWTAADFAPALIEDVRAKAGGMRVLIPVSGSVDPAVTAALLQKAIGARLSCLFIDTGFLRKGEAELVARCFRDEMGLNLIEVDARERFLKALSGITDATQKRRVIREEFSAIFAEQYVKAGEFECMAEGTIYPDVLRRRPRIVGNMIDGCKRLDPLKYLFKEDVRALGRVLGVPEVLIERSAFESGGLAVRCLGEVTRERLEALREADAIFHEEIERAGLTKRIAQHFAILTDLRTPGEDDGCVCALRALGTSNEGRAPAYKLPYDLMEAAVRRITGEVPGINRVVYDITGRPTASVEWE